MKMKVFDTVLRDREAFYDSILKADRIGVIVGKMLIGALILFAIYGVAMGLYNSPAQALSSAVKVPALFVLTLLVCYPALFIFNVLLGSKLTLGQSLAMILTAFMLSACVLASFAPIVIFFKLIGSSYTFLRLLHVAVFTVAGFTGMKALNDGLVYACEEHSVYPKQGVRVFQIWVLIFAFVGTQLAWNLRPFLGNRNLEFQLFRKQEGNFYSHVFRTFGDFILGDRDVKHGSEEKPNKSPDINPGLDLPEKLDDAVFEESATDAR
ncbi:MAG TPA: actin-binding WH2 domain-containing protein [candidate division Zixibacteria bacterium]|nr:actin-binding WH2 domain-containing protein [candidate division Zixibacteria bacterium]